jgi:hypothetical protein
MLRVFYLDVAKLDQDVAYIYASVSSVFIRMLQMFHLDVCICFNGYTLVFKFFLVFSCVSDVYCKCFSCFGRMLQVFHLDVVEVDRVLHMLQCA